MNGKAANFVKNGGDKMTKVQCPGCGHTVFKRVSIEAVEITIDETGYLTDQDPEVSVDLVAQPHKEDDVYDYGYKCVRCGRVLQETEMKPNKPADIGKESRPNPIDDAHDHET